VASISVIDYIGKVKDGVAIILSINIEDTIYQMIFWVNKHSKYVLTVDEQMLTMLNIKTIYEYENLEDLLKKIFLTLPPIEELFKKFEV